jgi:hypothetical protein
MYFILYACSPDVNVQLSQQGFGDCLGGLIVSGFPFLAIFIVHPVYMVSPDSSSSYDILQMLQMSRILPRRLSLVRGSHFHCHRRFFKLPIAYIAIMIPIRALQICSHYISGYLLFGVHSCATKRVLHSCSKTRRVLVAVSPSAICTSLLSSTWKTKNSRKS